MADLTDSNAEWAIDAAIAEQNKPAIMEEIVRLRHELVLLRDRFAIAKENEDFARNRLEELREEISQMTNTVNPPYTKRLDIVMDYERSSYILLSCSKRVIVCILDINDIRRELTRLKLELSV